MESIMGEVHMLAEMIKSEFIRNKGFAKIKASVETKIIDQKSLWIVFRDDRINKALEIPIPLIDKGLAFIIRNDIKRTVSRYWLEEQQKELSYLQVIEKLLLDDVNVIFPHLESGAPLIAKIARAFKSNQVSYMVMSAQRLIDEIINTMPLYETDMNTWAMNRRIIIIDPKFSEIRDPNKRLEYQVEKNKKYYERFGWTAIGLSDGVLADKNYLLDLDLRKFTPFGMFHNPQRNLYSTLCMQGDELPRIRTKSMQRLIDKGFERKGWNLVTAILDTPLTFEDQLLIDNRLRSLVHTITKKFTIYGDKIIVNENDTVKFGDKLGFSPDGTPIIMDLRCDEAKVIKIKRVISELDNMPAEIFVITIEGKRFLKDGSKLSNLHANKGIVKFVDLGVAINPKTGEEVPIDIMISGTSINKRKNFGQLLEILANNLNEGDEPIIIDDEFITSKDKIKEALKAKGFPEDGSWMINTYCGEFQAVVGKMFWGVTKDPEDQIWDNKKTWITNNRELRTSGLKFSHVEIKALVTRFGTGNPIIKEIMSHAQGIEILKDEIKILHSAKGEIDNNYPIIDAEDIRFVNLRTGFLHTIDEIKGTIVDDEFFPDGFIMKLPCYFQVAVNKRDKEDFSMGLPDDDVDLNTYNIYRYNKIFIPNSLLRRCWRHPSGKWGLSKIGILVNRIVQLAHDFIEDKSIINQNNLMRAISQYFMVVAKNMGTKRGELSTYGMAIRYPHSAHAVAALADHLPSNTIEIHRGMANQLKVKTGDIVLVERFPCLGFMSIRPQKVQVTDDPLCKYVIRVSGNSLVSLSLDFDGDTLFLASFHTAEAKEVLRKEFNNPNKVCIDAINKMNSKKVPQLKEMTFDDFNICYFPKPDNEEHAELVRKATGVKSHTGPVIALAYNLMRIVERNIPYSKTEEHAHLELLLDFLGNTVFKQKHGIKSLQEEATDAICVADVDAMVSLGFERRPSELLCNLIRQEAAKLGITDLKEFHMRAKARGGSKIINFIVRMRNKVYFATRASLGPFSLLTHLQDDAADLPSFMLKRLLRTQNESIEDKLERLKAEKMKIKDILTTTKMRDVYRLLSDYIDKMTVRKEQNI